MSTYKHCEFYKEVDGEVLKPRIFNFYSDPSHGWLKVPLRWLVKLDIAGIISSCSYFREGFVYLEEDDDLSKFINAMKERGYKVMANCSNTNKYSKIRSYDRYGVVSLQKYIS